MYVNFGSSITDCKLFHFKCDEANQVDCPFFDITITEQVAEVMAWISIVSNNPSSLKEGIKRLLKN